MKCGHIANAEQIIDYGERIPCCAICDCTTVIRECKGTDGLEGRKAKCNECNSEPVPSRWDLPFFKYCPDETYDTYYDGCYGWE